MHKLTTVRSLIEIAIFSVMFLQTPESQGSLPRRPPNPLTAQWQPLLPSMEKLFKERGIPCREQLLPNNVVDAVDFATQGISIALVDCGGAGAYTDSIIPVLSKNGILSIARVRQLNGE